MVCAADNVLTASCGSKTVGIDIKAYVEQLYSVCVSTTPWSEDKTSIVEDRAFLPTGSWIRVAFTNASACHQQFSAPQSTFPGTCSIVASKPSESFTTTRQLDGKWKANINNQIIGSYPPEAWPVLYPLRTQCSDITHTYEILIGNTTYGNDTHVSCQGCPACTNSTPPPFIPPLPPPSSSLPPPSIVHSSSSSSSFAPSLLRSPFFPKLHSQP